MFIKSVLDDVDSLVHDGVIYKVIKGIAHVPYNVAEHVTKFVHWQKVENVPEEIRKELRQYQTFAKENTQQVNAMSEPVKLIISEIKAPETIKDTKSKRSR